MKRFIILLALLPYLVVGHSTTVKSGENITDTNWTKGQKMLSAIGIYVLLKVVSWIPFVGWFISLVVIAAALGIVLLGIFRKPKNTPSELL